MVDAYGAGVSEMSAFNIVKAETSDAEILEWQAKNEPDKEDPNSMKALQLALVMLYAISATGSS